MPRRTTYRVAGHALDVEAADGWAATAVDALFAGWYVTPIAGAPPAGAAPAIVVRSGTRPPPIPPEWPGFAVAGGGTCYAGERASYIAIDGSVVGIRTTRPDAVEVWLDGALPLDSPALTRLVTYAVSAALRHGARFELHSAAVVEPSSGAGVLLTGPSGSGKSTLSVHLASSGWAFLTDDVVLLGRAAAAVTAWPLRRRFAITPDTLASSPFLRARADFAGAAPLAGKQPFLPHDVFAGGFRERCEPRVVIFPELTGGGRSRSVRLSSGDTMARLMRMNPWSCYDRATAAAHLSVLSAVSTQAAGWALEAGRDLLDPVAAERAVAACVRG